MVTVHLLVKRPSVVVTVISVVPVATPETVPSAATVAIAASIVDQVMVLSVASKGAIDAVSLSGVPILTIAVACSNVTPEALTITGSFLHDEIPTKRRVAMNNPFDKIRLIIIKFWSIIKCVILRMLLIV